MTRSLGLTFARDLLRITVYSQIGLHFSGVHLPSLIAVANEEQTEAGTKPVHDLVDFNVQNTRTIILAVVQANDDIVNQGII